MTRRFKTERAAQQQRSICTGLVELMLELDYAQITVRDICAKAGIPRRTFYYYFDGKDQVLDHLLGILVRECTLESMLPTVADREVIQAGFARFFRFWRDSCRRELKALIKNSFGEKLVRCSVEWIETESIWAESIRNKITGLGAIGTQIGTTVVFYVLFYWCEGGFIQPEEEVAAYTTELLTKPIYQIQ